VGGGRCDDGCCGGGCCMWLLPLSVAGPAGCARCRAPDMQPGTYQPPPATPAPAAAPRGASKVVLIDEHEYRLQHALSHLPGVETINFRQHKDVAARLQVGCCRTGAGPGRGRAGAIACMQRLPAAGASACLAGATHHPLIAPGCSLACAPAARRRSSLRGPTSPLRRLVSTTPRACCTR
jgi:hypothetical protein